MSAHWFKMTLALAFLMMSGSAGCQSEKAANMDLSTVENLNLKRYMGTWFEIARFDHSFERNLVGVTATYALQPNGKITVLNQGYKKSLDGKLKRAKGKAKQPDRDDPGKLKVAFFLFFYADYYILELEENYRWALVGSSSDEYLWILSRTPSLEQQTLDQILSKARERGYDTDKLIWVKQKESPPLRFGIIR